MSKAILITALAGFGTLGIVWAVDKVLKMDDKKVDEVTEKLFDKGLNELSK